MEFLLSEVIIDTGIGRAGAIFRPEGSEHFGIHLVIPRDEWMKMGRPISFYVDEVRD